MNYKVGRKFTAVTSTISILTLLFVFVFSAFARLGETANECIVRYGQPTKAEQIGETWIKAIFRFDGYELAIIFNDGSAVALFYSREDGGEIEDVQKILLLNIIGRKLVELAPDNMGNLNWETSDEEVGANLNPSRKLMSIFSQEFIEAYRDYLTNQKKGL